MNDINIVCEVYGCTEEALRGGCERCGHKGALKRIKYGQSSLLLDGNNDYVDVMRYQAMAQQQLQANSLGQPLGSILGSALSGLSIQKTNLFGGQNV